MLLNITSFCTCRPPWGRRTTNDSLLLHEVTSGHTFYNSHTLVWRKSKNKIPYSPKSASPRSAGQTESKCSVDTELKHRCVVADVKPAQSGAARAGRWVLAPLHWQITCLLMMSPHSLSHALTHTQIQKTWRLTLKSYHMYLWRSPCLSSHVRSL